MPTIKTTPKDKAKVNSTAQDSHAVTTPRRARQKSRKSKSENVASASDLQSIEPAESTDQRRRSRSRSRGRRLLDAAVSRISIGRSRSKSKSREKKWNISSPIVNTETQPDFFGSMAMLGTTDGYNSGDNNNNNNNGEMTPTSIQDQPGTPSVYRVSQIESLYNSRDSGFHADPHQDLLPTAPLPAPRVIHRPTPRVPVATDSDWNQSEIISRVNALELESNVFCKVCSTQISPEEDSCQMIDSVYHPDCFNCYTCGKEAEKENAAVLKDEKNATEKSPDQKGDATPERRSSTLGAQRMGNLRNKFESGEISEKKARKKQVPKIKYAGAESVKNKFMESANKTTNGTANGPPEQKEFTPPPEGVAVGVLESKPQPRAPDVVTADDSLEPIDFTVIGDTTKNQRAKFKHLVETGGQGDDNDEPKTSAYLEEFKSVAPEASTARARWKDIESGKPDPDAPVEEKRKIDMLGEGYGGVFENEPEQLENIVRGGDDNRALPTGFSAKERREEFLRKANETSVKKDTRIEIAAAESGIYENEPARRDDVIRYDDEQSDEYPPTTVKWASEAKNRFMQEAEKTQQRTERVHPFAVVDESTTNGDSADHRFASQAKQAFLERQRSAEEAEKKRERPNIIDIWAENGAHSGVFENTPAARSADVVTGTISEEEDETEGTDEE